MLDIFPYLPTLVVEQAPMSRRLLEAYLTLLNFTQIDEAEDVAAATRVLAKGEHSLIFVDIGLGDVNGLEFIRYLARRRQSHPALLIAMGEDRIKIRTHAIRAGADRFLGRPTSPDLLENMLIDLLTSRTAWKTKIVPLPTSWSGMARRNRLLNKEKRNDL